MHNKNIKIRRKILILSILLSLSISVFMICMNSKTIYSEDHTTEEITKTHNWGQDKCPVNVSGLVATSYIDEDFSKLSVEDYEKKIDEFSYKLKNSLLKKLSDISYKQYGTSIDFEEMSNIVSGKTPVILTKKMTPEDNMEITNEINSCFNRGLIIATTVEKAIISSESQNYVTNSLLNMMNNIQKNSNEYRTEHLEKEASKGSKFTSYPLNPIK